MGVHADRRLGQVNAWELLTEENRRGGRGGGEAWEGAAELEAAVLEEPWRMAVVGRLDKDSRGLLLMTQDGVIAKKVIGTQSVWKR